jgi:fucose 4-O-acetylase-like acetyltransferase
MVLLVFVHGYNLNESYLQPWTIPNEQLTFTTFTEYFLSNGIFRFRIPMLFIISGYLFALGDNIPHKIRVNKRVKTLLYPYLIWSAVGLSMTYFLEIFTYSRSIIQATSMMQIDNTRTLLHQYHWYEVLAGWIFFPASYQLWFIRVLLIYNLCYKGILWCITHKIAKYIFFAICILLWLSTSGFVLFEGEGLLFFSLGVWMQKNQFNIDSPSKWLKPKIWLLVFLLTTTIKTSLAFKGYFNGVFPMLTILHKLVIISGLIKAWYGSNKLVTYFMKRKWFVNISAFAFMIYVIHAPIVVYINKATFLQFNSYSHYRMILFIFVPIVLIVAAIILGYCLRKFLPKFYAFATGGRGF